MTGFDPEILTKERSMYEILLKYIFTLKFDFNFKSSATVATFLVFYVFQTTEPITGLLIKLRSLLDLEFTYTITILGFIVAGFSIFAAVTDKELFVLKALTKTACGVNDLKLSFFRFIYVFFIYILIAFVIVLTKIFACQDCLVSTIFLYIPHNQSEVIKGMVIKTCYVVAGTSFVYSVLLLKSFVFNIYKIMIDYVRLKIELRGLDFDELYDKFKENYEKDGRDDS